jgi:GNAT superfamily N-acetyltransferase
MIRLARGDEVEALRTVERRAATRFATVGLAAAAELPVTDAATLRQGIVEDRVWAAVDGDDAPVGFAIAEVAGDDVHLREIDVVPEVVGRGVGSALIDAVVAFARARGAIRVTLTTFRDVPWNAPFYARRGFAIVDEPLPPRLAAQRAAEIAHGIDLVPRVAMSRDL